jgi:molybdopterin-guanine dinucleotide biosynthesis protein A
MQRETEPLFAILAGGRATRLGGDKVLARLGGRPLISYPLEAAHAANAEILVVAKPGTELPELEVEVLREPPEPFHPLCGIVAALERAGEQPVIVVAADMPFVTGELLAWMEGIAEPLAVPRHGGRLHPLLGRYDGSVLEQLKSALKAERALQETVSALSPRLIGDEELGRFGDPERLLFNVNTPEDLARAEAAL